MTISRSSILPEMAIFDSFLWLSMLPLYLGITSFSSVDGPVGVFPCLGYCKQCCSEHGGPSSYSNYGFFQIYAQVVYF